MHLKFNSYQESTKLYIVNTAYLLIMLTVNAADQAGLSFVSTQTQEQCQLKGRALAGILSSSGIQVKENRCIKSDMQFSKYRHSEKGSRPLYTYEVIFRADTVDVRLIPRGETCEADQENSYCATSPQRQTG